MNFPEELRPYVNDYHMNLFEIAWLTDEQVAMFKSDFKIVADYCVQLRKNKKYVPSKETIKHVDAVLKLMTALTGDHSFEETINNTPEEERGEITMCEVIDAAKREGERKGRFEMLVSMVNDYIAKKKISQKAACEDLSVSYSKYMAAKRYLKKMELQGIQE